MHELDADGAAVGFLQRFDDFAQGSVRLQKAHRVKYGIEIGIRKSVRLQGEQGVGKRAGGEGVGAGEQVAEIAVTVDQRIDRRLLARQFRRRAAILAERETAKKSLPVGGECFRRLTPATVLFFDPLRADIGKNIHNRPHGKRQNETNRPTIAKGVKRCN